MARTSEDHNNATVSPARIQAVRSEVRTPYKYGVVIQPSSGKKVDCPAVFRYHGKWYMVYVQFETSPFQGYTTQLAESPDLLHWKPLGTILFAGDAGAWDHANAAGGNRLVRYEMEWRQHTPNLRRPLLALLYRWKALRLRTDLVLDWYGNYR